MGDDFTKKGGLKTMGEALGRGMVLTVSIWDDIAVNMNWLDSIGDSSVAADTPGNRRGPCGVDDGIPKTLRAEHPEATYKFANLKVGDIGTTQQTPSPTPAPVPVPSPVPTPTPAGSGACCYGGCDGGNCQGGWCGASQGNCENNCNGEWCPAAALFVV